MIITSSQNYFSTIVEEAFLERNLESFILVKSYLSSLLEHYLLADNFYEICEDTGSRKLETLAEMYLKANQLKGQEQTNLFKKLGDQALYVSGFFSHSIKKKLVNVDYYISMGESAYGNLAQIVKVDTSADLFNEISNNFVDYMDVLMLISHKVNIQKSFDVFTLLEQHDADSKLACEKLIELGIPVLKKVGS